MQLFNSFTRVKEELPPPPGPIRMYVCGPTVYQRIHVGNARPYVISLWLKRWLELKGYEVKLVENITDVNDKIYDAAREQGIPSAELARQAGAWYIEDTEELGLGRPDEEPLASETIPEIVALIEELIERNLAYESGGDVYFRVASYPEYGALSGAKLDDMIAQEPSDLKEDPRDFALWKATKPHEEDTWWDSPWGKGRPGWHIECSAMAEKHLGPVFEIHGGGLDLRFPHHENELAQSRGAGREFARIWAHNGMLELAEEKMSKSVGNIVSLRDALDRWGREALLLFFAGAHYRSPIQFSEEAMAAAAAQVESLWTAYRVAERSDASPTWEDFAASLNDDFNTPAALAIVHAWRRADEHDLLRKGMAFFGLETKRPVGRSLVLTYSIAGQRLTTEGVVMGTPSPELIKLAEERLAARAEGDFERADEIRAQIEALGWEVQDKAGTFRLIPRA